MTDYPPYTDDEYIALAHAHLKNHGKPPTQDERQCWGWRDSRDGTPVSITSVFTKEQAERQLEEWRERDAAGGRPGLHELMPFIEVYRIW